MSKNKQSALERFEVLRKSVVQSTPAPKLSGAPEVRVSQALHEHKPIVAIKQFSAGDGLQYAPGDAINTDGWPESRLLSMAQHGYVLPGSEFDDAMAWQERHDALNKLEPLKSRIDAGRSEVEKALQKVGAARAALLVAERDLSDASGRVASYEQDLSDALSGDNVLQLFAE